MLSFRPLRWTLALVCGLFVIAGCTASTDTPQGETGALSLDLIIADDVEINSVTWTITGGDMEPMSDTIDTSAPGATASVEVFGLPPGDDYTVKLEATDESGEVTCEGSADFAISLDQDGPTNVMVMLNCKLPRTLGGVRVNGEFNVCPQLTKAVVSPLQTSIGNVITLQATAEDVEGDPITYVWSGTGGTIADPNAQNTTYTCGELGPQSVMILVSDDGGEYCMDMWPVNITCVEGDGDLCEGQEECPDTGNDCTEANCNPANGQCEESNLPDGTDCDGGEGMCMNGVCEAADLCAGQEECPDTGNDCTEANCNPENGECEESNLPDGTACEDETGMCMGGQCVIIDLCEGQEECPDTGNECTIGICNNQTGECDETNLPNDTECNQGAGVCTDGVCVDNDLCEGEECISTVDCVQDGTCDPSNGECIPGDPQPIDTACDDDGGAFCDGAGNCVPCNDGTQCPDDTNECTVPACEGNQCGLANAMDGTTCDFNGGDGVCEGGTCVEAPQCTIDDDCNEMNMNVCVTGTCVAGACEFDPVDGGPCEVEPGVPGTCGGGMCVGLCEGEECISTEDCVGDGTCDIQSGECIPGDNLPQGTDCDENGGSVCNDSGVCVQCNDNADCTGENEVCVDSICVVEAAASCNEVQTGMETMPQSEIVSVGCVNNVTTAQSPFPFTLIVDVPVAIGGGEAFAAGLDGIGLFPEFFLNAAQNVVPGGVKVAELVAFQATVQVRSGASGDDVALGADLSSLTPGPTRLCNFPPDQTCMVNTDCLGQVCNPPIVLQELPTVDGIENSPGGCFTNGGTQAPPDCDCSPCAALDTPPDTTKLGQCELNGFCQDGDLIIEFQEETGNYTADASGQVLWGWADSAILCPSSDPSACTAAFHVDDCFDIPPPGTAAPIFADRSAPTLIRVNASGLAVPIDCALGSDGGSCSMTTTQGCLADADCPGAETCVGVGVDDDIICPTPDSALIACPIN